MLFIDVCGIFWSYEWPLKKIKNQGVSNHPTAGYRERDQLATGDGVKKLWFENVIYGQFLGHPTWWEY